MKKISIIILLFLAFTKVDGQIFGPNLVNNPSFEQYDSCPDMMDELYKSKYWWGNSTEYFNNCASLYVSVPSNLFGFQYAHTGVAYAGLIIYANDVINCDYREAIKTKLNDKLIANKSYCTNFYISFAEKIYQNYNIYFDSIGMLLTKDLVSDTVVAFLSNGIKVQNSIANLDTLNWLKISNSFISNGGEEYLTISNFDNIIHYPSGLISEVYVFVDDVSVCECSFEFNLGRDTTLCDGEALLLNPNMPNAIYTWQDSSHASTYNITQAGTYWVRAYFPDYGITTSSSINITYDGECLKIPNVITPNNDGKNDYFVIENSEGWNIDLQILNRWGTIIYQNNTYKNTWNGKDVADGVYYYIIKATNNNSGIVKNYKGSVTLLR